MRVVSVQGAVPISVAEVAESKPRTWLDACAVAPAAILFAVRFLHRWTGNAAKGAKYTAVAGLRPQQLTAAGAVIEK